MPCTTPPSDSFASFIENLERWFESFGTQKPFYIVGDSIVDVLQNSKTASFID